MKSFKIPKQYLPQGQTIHINKKYNKPLGKKQITRTSNK